tara:strand:+ start:288 stop:512 length:225 start_codon:yes stop_codon:yes gene_type:complete
MHRVYKITEFEVDDHLFKFEEGEWVKYGKIVLEQGTMFGIRTNTHEGILMLRDNVLYSEGFIASKDCLDKPSKG